MKFFEATQIYQAVADDTSALVHQRLSDATPIRVLSDRGDKLLQVVQEADGKQVVTRSFSGEAVDYVERHGLPFTEAWDIMHTVFSAIGAPVVPSVLLSPGGEYPYVAVSQYLADEVPVSAAPIELKTSLATGLGRMLRGFDGYMPAPEMINREMFQVSQQGDKTDIVLIDTDPHMIEKPIYGADILNARHIEKIGRLLYDEWCTEDDRATVMPAFIRSVGDIVLDDVRSNPHTFAAFSNVHMMAQGVDMRAFNT